MKREYVGFEILNSFADSSIENLETYYAWSMLGCCYRFGSGVAKDRTDAYKWFKKSSDKGMVFADYMLGCMYNVDKKYEKAQYYLKKAADNGWDWANLTLGKLYFNEVSTHNLAYCYLMKASYLNSDSKKTLEKILASGCIQWDISNHKYWPNTIITSSLHLKQLDKEFDKVVYVTSFDDQVLTLLLISKFRHTSSKSYISHLSKMVVLSVVKHLAYVLN